MQLTHESEQLGKLNFLDVHRKQKQILKSINIGIPLQRKRKQNERKRNRNETLLQQLYTLLTHNMFQSKNIFG